MKITKIHFKNLNSLVGEWEIDFTDPVFRENSIFAITGPTGSGKTTILDALCLALYGQTPRLHKITKGENEIMSRQESECSAEVSFETGKGRYRVFWGQRRARGKKEGELQAHTHELVDGTTNEIIEKQRSKVADKVAELTGLDFTQFTRAMLLAQGGFAAFLQAAADERSPILEQITGTEIYSAISKHVHTRTREAELAVTKAQAEAPAAPLTEEEEREQLLSLQTLEQEDAAVSAKERSLQEAYQWRTELLNLSQKMEKTKNDLQQLGVKLTAFAPKREQLHRAQTASRILSNFETLKDKRQNVQKEGELLAREEAQVPELEKKCAAGDALQKSCEEALLACKKALEEALPTYGAVRALDQEITMMTQQMGVQQKLCQQSQVQLKKEEAELRASQGQLAKVGQQKEAVQKFLEEKASDALLVEALAGIKEQCAFLGQKQKELFFEREKGKKLEKDRLLGAKNLELAQKATAQAREKVEQVRGKIRALQEERTKVLGTRDLAYLREKKEDLQRELVLIQRVMSYEEQRTQLQDGHACPLCGALEHPYAQGNIPTLGDTEKQIAALSTAIATVEKIDAEEKKLIAEEQKRSAEGFAAESKEMEGRKDQENFVQRINESAAQLTSLEEAYFAQAEKLRNAIAPLGFRELPSSLEAFLGGLEKRLAQWQNNVAAKERMEKELLTLTGEMEKRRSVMATMHLELANKEAQLKELQAKRETVVERRRGLFGEKNVDQEELQRKKSITLAEEQEKRARSTQFSSQKELQTKKARIATLQEQLAKSRPILDAHEREFALDRTELGFPTEQAYCAALLSQEQMTRLQAQEKELTTQETSLTALLHDQEEQVQREESRKVTTESKEALEKSLIETRQKQKQITAEVATRKQTLKENALRKERAVEHAKRLDALNGEWQRWKNLHELIGSSDGKKFRNFAQALTFERLVRLANEQLKTMTDRYTLFHNPNQALEMQVLDAYQAASIRSTKNLSGGESFLVSLALALGLSQMASQNVRVDSLFLDEGFGTLDEEALETALNTLVGLGAKDKMICIISHVAALKERITTKIQVIPETEGRSHLQGPGCKRVQNEPAFEEKSSKKRQV